MNILPWCPEFVIGSTSYLFTYPVTRWIPGERTTGAVAKGGDGRPGNDIQLRRYTLGMTLRFTDDEWIMVREFLFAAQTGRVFDWHPNALIDVFGMPEVFDITLDKPRVSDAINPLRDSVNIRLLSLPIIVASTSVFHAYYFPLE